MTSPMAVGGRGKIAALLNQKLCQKPGDGGGKFYPNILRTV